MAISKKGRRKQLNLKRSVLSRLPGWRLAPTQLTGVPLPPLWGSRGPEGCRSLSQHPPTTDRSGSLLIFASSLCHFHLFPWVWSVFSPLFFFKEKPLLVKQVFVSLNSQTPSLDTDTEILFKRWKFTASNNNASCSLGNNFHFWWGRDENLGRRKRQPGCLML